MSPREKLIEVALPLEATSWALAREEGRGSGIGQRCYGAGERPKDYSLRHKNAPYKRNTLSFKALFGAPFARRDG